MAIRLFRFDVVSRLHMPRHVGWVGRSKFTKFARNRVGFHFVRIDMGLKTPYAQQSLWAMRAFKSSSARKTVKYSDVSRDFVLGHPFVAMRTRHGDIGNV